MSITEPRKVLLTGATGFTGHYVAQALAAAGHTAVTPRGSFDLSDPDSVRDSLAGLEFDDVIHLAAISFVGHADPVEFYKVNTVGTSALLEAVCAYSETVKREIGRVILASSANIYGNSASSPIAETAVPMPTNHYAGSKAAMELLSRAWFDRLPLVIARPFNYTGRGQAEHFLVPKIVWHFVRREAEIELGNIDVIRDFSDVRDVAAAYLQLLRAPAGTVVNICSGEGRSLRSVIDYCHKATGHSIKVKINPAFVRPNEVHELVGSDARLMTLLESSKRRSLDDTVDWMLRAGE